MRDSKFFKLTLEQFDEKMHNRLFDRFVNSKKELQSVRAELVTYCNISKELDHLRGIISTLDIYITLYKNAVKNDVYQDIREEIKRDGELYIDYCDSTCGDNDYQYLHDLSLLATLDKDTSYFDNHDNWEQLNQDIETILRDIDYTTRMEAYQEFSEYLKEYIVEDEENTCDYKLEELQ